jgi:glycosyltransferase involved in cell wall biosynthesis
VDDLARGAEAVQLAVLTEQLYAPVPGGTARFTCDLLAALAASRPAQDAAVMGWSARHPGAGDTVKVAGGQLDPGLLQSEHQLALSRRALSLAWSFGLGPVPAGADVVHAPTPLAPPRRGRPLVVTVHDDVPWTHPQTLTRYGARWHRRIGLRIGRDADLVITPTAAVASRLRDVLPGLTEDRLVVAANPLPRQRAERLRATLVDEDARMSRLGLAERGYLLFVGTAEPRKGLDILLSALGRPGGPELPVVVVGQAGWGSVGLAGAADRVRRLGALCDDDLGVAYRHAAAVVLPSRAEGFGYPVVEAMTAGVPVVTSDDPALVETGGGATLVAPIGDALALARALRDLETDDVLRAELIARGRVRALDFDEAAYGRTMWQLYARL